MLFKSQLFSALAAVAVVNASGLLQTWGSATKTTELRSINPPVGLHALRDFSEVRVAKRSTSNAERLTRGLPLNPPTRRHNKAGGHHAHGHHAGGAHPPHPSSVYQPRSITGFFEAIVPENGNFIGYVRKSLNDAGEFGLTANVNERLSVSINLDAATSGSTNIVINNGADGSYPFFSGVVGFYSTDDSLFAGSANYAYIGASNESPVNSPAFEADNSVSESEYVQSAIFTYNPTSHLISAHWVNTDGSTPATSYAYLKDEDALVIVGDIAAFSAKYQAAEAIAFRFVSVY